MKFSYFYGNESDRLTFYRIPKLLITDEYFRNVSTDAKVLYGLMLDRMGLSAKNGWLDAEKRVFIYFSIEDVMLYLNCSHSKAVKIMAELDDKGEGIGLIHREKKGQGKPAIIYVKNFFSEERTSSEVSKTDFRATQNQTSRSPKIGSLEVSKSDANKNNINNTELSECSSIRSMEPDADTDTNARQTVDILDIDNQQPVYGMDTHTPRNTDVGELPDYAGYRELIREQIEYSCLLDRYPTDRDTIEGIVDLMLEVALTEKPALHIAGDDYPTDFVRDRFRRINFGHIEYVMACMQKNTSKVRNIKAYMLTALFNAPGTMNSYYRAEVNHDMPQYAG